MASASSDMRMLLDERCMYARPYGLMSVHHIYAACVQVIIMCVTET